MLWELGLDTGGLGALGDCARAGARSASADE